MPFRFRKSFKVAPGVRLKVGKRGGSVTVGGRRARVTQSTAGRRIKSVSGPRGSGLGYSTTKEAGCLMLPVLMLGVALWLAARSAATK